MQGDVHLNLDHIFLPFIQAANRLRYFSCIGAYGSEKAHEIKEWAAKVGIITYNVPTPSAEDLNKLKTFFPLWLNSILLRDMLEGFYYAFDRIYYTCSLVILVNNGTFQKGKNVDSQAYENFIHKGADDKRDTLKSEFGIKFSKEEYKKIYKGIKDIRDCLSHQNGLVTRELGHSAKKEKRRISWLTLKVFTSLNGKNKKIELDKIIEGNGDLILKVENHNKEFFLGEKIVFSREEIIEILHTFEWLKKDLMSQVLDFVNKHGMQVTKK